MDSKMKHAYSLFACILVLLLFGFPNEVAPDASCEIGSGLNGAYFAHTSQDWTKRGSPCVHVEPCPRVSIFPGTSSP